MKLVKIVLPILALLVVSCSKNNENSNAMNVKLPIGDHSVLYDYSNLTWKGQKITGSSHTGNLSFKSAKIKISEEGIISGNLIIDMNTMTCTDIENSKYNKYLVDHLKNDDFFSTDKFPESKIKFQSIKRTGNMIEFDGTLTIKNISNPISFTANLYESDGKILASSDLVFDRSKFDIRYGSGTFFENLGDDLIIDEINIEVNLAINQ